MFRVKKIKQIIPVFIAGLFISSCYTQLALMDRSDYYQTEEEPQYYYEEDTLYAEDTGEEYISSYYINEHPDINYHYMAYDPWYYDSYGYYGYSDWRCAYPYPRYLHWYPYWHNWYVGFYYPVYDYGWGHGHGWASNKPNKPRPFVRNGRTVTPRGDGSSRVALGNINSSKIGKAKQTNGSQRTTIGTAKRKSTNPEFAALPTRTVRAGGSKSTSVRSTRSRTTVRKQPTVIKRNDGSKRKYYRIVKKSDRSEGKPQKTIRRSKAVKKNSGSAQKVTKRSGSSRSKPSYTTPRRSSSSRSSSSSVRSTRSSSPSRSSSVRSSGSSSKRSGSARSSSSSGSRSSRRR